MTHPARQPFPVGHSLADGYFVVCASLMGALCSAPGVMHFMSGLGRYGSDFLVLEDMPGPPNASDDLEVQ